MVSEVSLREALDAVQSDTIGSRRQGLADLRHVLEYNRRLPTFKDFKDPSLHAIYEGLFQPVTSDRSSYLKSTKGGTTYAARLESAAAALRVVVDLTVDLIRLKTLRVLTGHIIQTLPVAGGGFCEPLSTDYVKALRAILEYTPHAEHLPSSDWLNIVDFCLDGINDLSDEMTLSSNSFSRGASNSQDSNGISGRTASYSARHAARSAKARDAKNTVLDLIICLNHLVSTPNCPINSKTQDIMACVFGFLQSSSSTTIAHPSAMAIISCTLSRVSLSSVDTTNQILGELFSVPTDIWQMKDTTLWDEMLISLIHGRAHLMRLVDKDTPEGLSYGIEGLYERLAKEYFNILKQSGERTLLELHDFALGTDDSLIMDKMPMQTRTFRLGNVNPKSERHWTTLQMLSFFASWIDCRNIAKTREDLNPIEEGPQKRRRVTTKIDDLLEQSSKPSSIEDRIGALQIVAFYLHQRTLDVGEVQAVSKHLLQCISHSSSLISSWAMVALASCSLQPCSAGETLNASWMTTWQIAIRLISSAGHSRTACHLLKSILESHCLEYLAVAESVENTLFASALNGPALLSDSALSFWVTILHEKFRTNPSGVGKQNFEQMVAWVFSKWNPGKFEDRSLMHQTSREVSPSDLGRLFNLATKGPSNYPPPQKFACLEKLGLVWLTERRNRALKDYLLLLNESSVSSFVWKDPDFPLQSESMMSLWSQARVDDLVAASLAAEIDKTLAEWRIKTLERSVQLTRDIVTNLVRVAAMADVVAKNIEPRLPSASKNLAHLASTLLKQIVPRNGPKDPSPDVIDALLENIAPLLPGLDTSDANLRSQTLPNVLPQLESLCRAQQTNGIDDNNEDEDDDDVGSDDIGMKSPRERFSGRYIHEPVLHSEVASLSSRDAFNSSVKSYLVLTSLLFDPKLERDFVGASTTFYEHLISLPYKELIASRNILDVLFSPTYGLTPISVESLLKLVDHLTDGILSSYEYERSEVTMGLCLEVMRGTVRLWAEEISSDLVNAVADLYDWFIEKAWGARIASANAQILLADVLFELLEINADYAQNIDEAKPSVRTTLFRMLKSGEIPVQYHIAKRIPTVFSHFVLSQHQAIFDDIRSNLSEEEHPIEGMLLRLFVLARIAIWWKTLLRPCVYYIFEVGAEIGESVGHAGYCMAEVATAYGLTHPRELFWLFSPQILYTWLESSHKLKSMPPRIFGCENTQELLRNVLDEAAAQVAMLGGEERIEDFDGAATVSYKTLLTTSSFPKAIAYGYARDISNAKPGGHQLHDNENRVRNFFSNKAYTSRVTEDFALIFGHLLMTLDQENNFDKYLSKNEKWTGAAAILHRIKKLNSSIQPIPPSQQPSFRSKHVFGALERLCRRTERDIASVWTPGLVLTVARMLFADVNPVHGPIHARRVLQRVRILISLGGKIACEGYTLERFLHALRPFLAEGMCSEDAMGLFQYLMEEGKPYLSTNPSFLVGTTLATLLSLRHFITTSPDSTTQESIHRQVTSKAGAFRKWLGTFVSSFEIFTADNEFSRICGVLLKYGQKATNPGNANLGTAESHLLLLMLQDQGAKHRVLNRSFYRLCLHYLLIDFEPPPTPRDDCLGDEGRASQLGSRIWELCRYEELGNAFKKWAVATLGRAFNHRGQVPDEAFAETNFKSLSSPNDLSTPDSRSAIVSCLAERLLDKSAVQVALLEETLSIIISQYRKPKTNEILDVSLPHNISSALAECHQATASTVLSVKETGGLSDMFSSMQKPTEKWISNLAVALCVDCKAEPVLVALPRVLQEISGLAASLFPYILHLSLSCHKDFNSKLRHVVSQGFNQCLSLSNEGTTKKTSILVSAILYLRNQEIPQERTELDRDQWLNIDYEVAAAAARKCSMFKTALMFVELSRDVHARSSATRQSMSFVNEPLPTDLLLSIFTEIDEPDSFYGVQQPYGLEALADRLDYEGNASAGLLLRGAQFDSLLRRGAADQTSAAINGVIGSLTKLNLNSLSHQLLTTHQGPQLESSVTEGILRSAMKLRKWDVATSPGHTGNTSTMYRVLQGIHGNYSSSSISELIVNGSAEIFNRITDLNQGGQAIRSSFSALAALNEMHEVLSAQGSEQALEICTRLQHRAEWMETKPLEDVTQILTVRDTLFGMLSDSIALQESMQLSKSQARMIEIEANLQSSAIYRKHGALQECLGNVAYLTDLVEPCREIGVYVDGAVGLETAHILWEREEPIPAIKMLQSLNSAVNFASQTVAVDKAVVLATTGRYVANARLEKSNEILDRYLTPSIAELGQRSTGIEAGQVFHDFAMYCHAQLENPDFEDEFRRSEKFRNRKHAEIQDLERIIRNTDDDEEIRRAKSDRNKAKTWLSIDDGEYQRLRKDRQTLLQRSLDHYLLSLAASDEHDTDLLRFVALWLANSENIDANQSLSQYIRKVPSRKFVALMNQLASRLQDTSDVFQRILGELVERICTEHPYHGMYHIFAGEKTKGGNDKVAQSRNSAAQKIARHLQTRQDTTKTWSSVYRSNELYIDLAKLRPPESKDEKKGLKLGSFRPSKRVEVHVPSLKVPPITMSIRLKEDMDYSKVPVITQFKPELGVASGLSAPKVITAITSDGQYFKQLYKSGSDDLRQDAIMEQVFTRVTDLLKRNRDTRQRDLRIRIYNVVPLTATSGVIEFVPNSVVLNDWLMPAHAKYNPKDLKWSACREKTLGAHKSRQETRVKTYRDIASRFSPVFRHFFFERFKDPDEWFERRLSYTRSTAAISILGHALGLGDRHCQNILLDANTGEVIHIDLGVAFETGRILAIPEVVPFRLTRDIVDGFGIMKTEGVFRRCCEFTLEALRQNKDAIMTLLNVLRYDPLYSWSVSPLRAKRLQEEQEREMAAAGGAAAGNATESSTVTSTTTTSRSRRSVNGKDDADGVGQPEPEQQQEIKKREDEDEGGEADRALTVVERKLAAGLSVTATVNELIQQATDETNLAMLFCGWAAFA